MPVFHEYKEKKITYCRIKPCGISRYTSIMFELKQLLTDLNLEFHFIKQVTIYIGL